MAELILDINEIKFRAVKNRVENKAFVFFLKSKANEHVDSLVFELNKSISAQIDCKQCANCCKTLHPAVTNSEAEVLAAEKKLDADEFRKSFLLTDEAQNINYFKVSPCIFLLNNQCSCYERRPVSCADYPHLSKPNFKYRMRSVMENYKMCPIAFNTVEQLKNILGFQKQV